MSTPSMTAPSFNAGGWVKDNMGKVIAAVVAAIVVAVIVVNFFSGGTTTTTTTAPAASAPAASNGISRDNAAKILNLIDEDRQRLNLLGDKYQETAGRVEKLEKSGVARDQSDHERVLNLQKLNDDLDQRLKNVTKLKPLS